MQQKSGWPVPATPTITSAHPLGFTPEAVLELLQHRLVGLREAWAYTRRLERVYRTLCASDADGHYQAIVAPEADLADEILKLDRRFAVAFERLQVLARPGEQGISDAGLSHNAYRLVVGRCTRCR